MVTLLYQTLDVLVLLYFAKIWGPACTQDRRLWTWIYPWISTENQWIWIWIWMGNFTSTASLVKCQFSCVARTVQSEERTTGVQFIAFHSYQSLPVNPSHSYGASPAIRDYTCHPTQKNAPGQSNRLRLKQFRLPVLEGWKTVWVDLWYFSIRVYFLLNHGFELLENLISLQLGITFSFFMKQICNKSMNSYLQTAANIK